MNILQVNESNWQWRC